MLITFSLCASSPHVFEVPGWDRTPVRIGWITGGGGRLLWGAGMTTD